MDRDLKILYPNLAHIYAKYGYYICKAKEKYLVTTGFIPKKYSKYDHIIHITESKLYQNLDREFSKYNSHKAINNLEIIDEKATAKNINYVSSVTKFILFLTLLICFSNEVFIFLHHIIYLVQNLLKFSLFTFSRVTRYDGIKLKIKKRKLPIYSILIPLYKEANGVKAIIHHISQLNYPKELLDIKLVVEKDDIFTLGAIGKIDIPSHIHIIEVPYSHPRTKPKAINYAMQYIKGEFVVIYDVEDRPEPNQLLHAISAFNELPKTVICLQAKLRFYNHHTNLLSKFFNIEYQIWFDYLLPSMDKWNMPLPLGGNSNHFRVEPIRKLGLWDAYNVTEDADLGIRLFMHGYKTKIIDSYSFEEAPTDIFNWLNQRSRWIKGFIQTYLVYLNQSPKLKSNMSIKSKIFINIFIGVGTYSFFILPLYFIISGHDYILPYANLYMTFIYMYFSATCAVVFSTHILKNARWLDFLALILWPFYFLLHSIASYKALLELIIKPFSWNKTEHKMDDGGP